MQHLSLEISAILKWLNMVIKSKSLSYNFKSRKNGGLNKHLTGFSYEKMEIHFHKTFLLSILDYNFPKFMEFRSKWIVRDNVTQVV